jgi:hypothetical protein
VLGIGVPLTVKALAAAAGDEKSTKQYPALLLWLPVSENLDRKDNGTKKLPRELIADHLDIDLLAHLEPEVANEIFINPWFEFTHPETRGISQMHAKQEGKKGGKIGWSRHP